MLREQEVLSVVTSVSDVQLRVWVSEEWVKPAHDGTNPIFNDADVARVRLLDTLINQLEIDHEATPIILSLIDQVHDLRAQMRSMSQAIEGQPDDVRKTISDLMGDRS
jgi:chaperone modulatory protein CbpM